MLPIVVVDVGGDRLDPTHTRELVAKELSVEAIAPGDPRAAEAGGRIDVTGNATDGTLTVRYRKLDVPIERSIPLAADGSQAETDAALLAGNLARDEASELTAPAKPPPAPPPPPPPPPSTPVMPAPTGAARDLAQLRAFITQSTDEQNAARRGAGWFEIGAGAVIAAPAVYLWTVDDPSSEASLFRISGSVVSAGLIGIGIATLVSESKGGDLEPIAAKLREHEKKGTPADEALADVEKEWAKRAENARSSRKMLGYIVAGTGAMNIALGGLTLALAPSSEGGSYVGLESSLLSAGFMMIVFGTYTVLTESGIESSHRLWRTVHAGSDGPRVSFGAAPLPGGGGAASLAVTF